MAVPTLHPTLWPSDDPIAVRTIELSQPLQPLLDVVRVKHVRVFALFGGIPVCWFDIANQFKSVEIAQLEASIALQATQQATQQARSKPIESLPLSAEISVSIVVATCDRPEALTRCLTHLVQQETPRTVEIWVIDNRPHSGITQPIVAQFSTQFPHVRYLAEPRPGGSFARNAGFAVSRGEIIVSVDDDVTVPQLWLERLIAPLQRSDVAVVTGNLLPLELETRSQQIFERYGKGGLGRGFASFEVGRGWFRHRWLAVPTWELGATANLAFRRSLLTDARVGDLDVVLGPGMPTGGGEDLYWFYRVLKAGYRLVYEPNAWGWHQHRSTMAALRNQVFNYGKGNLAYHLTVLTRDRDWRVLPTVLIFLPIYYLKRIIFWIGGDRAYPLKLTFLEIAGILAGPWSLWRSHQIIRHIQRDRPIP